MNIIVSDGDGGGEITRSTSINSSLNSDQQMDHCKSLNPGFINSQNSVKESLEKKEKFSGFFRKYFLQGQNLANDRVSSLGGTKAEISKAEIHLILEDNCKDTNDDLRANKNFISKYRNFIGLLLPFGFWHLIWWTLAVRYEIFELYPTHYELPISMIFGATIAGMTSEGGGAIAFPVMTLLLKIEPKVARDFSLMIQSCGMTSAAFTILWMDIKVEWHSIIFCSIGSTFGIIFGLQFVDDLLTGPEKKMLFVSIWFSFALSLYILNTQKKRCTFEKIPKFNWCKAIVLVGTGFAGGMCSAFAGSGVDICSFSILTLLFRVSEKVATPTSVILMAVNTCVGFYWRQLIMSEVSLLAWNYFACSVPVVVLCAPLGSLIASYFHRLVLASLVYILEVLAVVGFLLTKPKISLIITGAGIIAFSFIFFLCLSRFGEYLNKSKNQEVIKNEVKIGGKEISSTLEHSSVIESFQKRDMISESILL